MSDLTERLRSAHEYVLRNDPGLGVAAHETVTIWLEAADLIDQQALVIRELVEALDISQTALNDWVCVHAPDECSPASVTEAQGRIGEVGTLAYIVGVMAKNRAAIAKALP